MGLRGGYRVCGYSPFQRIGKNVVAVLHIYGDRTIFLLFFDHQDTESEL